MVSRSDGLVVIGRQPDEAPLEPGEILRDTPLRGVDGAIYRVTYRVVREATFEEWLQNSMD